MKIKISNLSLGEHIFDFEEKIEDQLRKEEGVHCVCCPNCGRELVEVRCRGVEVDGCPACNGFWFNFGDIKRTLREKGYLSGRKV